MPADPAVIAAGLVRWFRRHRRDLPWRRTPEAYAVWVSEVMLQQTRVEAVLPYYERFLRRFPSVEALAEAPPAEVLRLWAGLGYYGRARQLQRAAREVTARGAFPSSAAAWRELPGVGAYTAAAVASIAGGERVAVVDGNVRRVFARVQVHDAPRRSPALQQAAAAWGGALMAALPRRARPGELNQALMELGATVCMPRAPRCTACPLTVHCAGHAKGEPERWPRADPLPAMVELRLAFLLAGSDRHWLLRQRSTGWNQGLYEPPCLPDAGERELQEAWAGQGGSGRVSEELGRLHHAITRHRIRARVLRLDGWDGGGGVDPEQVPLTGLARKVLALAEKHSRADARARRRGQRP